MALSGVGAEHPVFEQSPASAADPPLPPVDAEGGFLRAARGLGREIDVGEARVADASQMRNYDTATLIALQVGIYRYTEAVDLASKIVDRASGAVRTVLQGSGH